MCISPRSWGMPVSRWSRSAIPVVKGPKASRANSIPHVFATVSALIAARLVDGVIIASPHVTHHPIAKECLESGLHAFIEKPMTTSAQDAFELVGLAERAGMQLAIGDTYQYADTAEFARTAVHTEIGEIVQVVVEFTSNAGDLFARAGDPAGRAVPVGILGGQRWRPCAHAIHPRDGHGVLGDRWRSP